MLISVALISCTKQNSYTNDTPTYLLYEFSVGEQVNVSHYEIETSTDGEVFKTAGILLASDKTEDLYSIKVDISKEFGVSPVIYSRIKSIDKDGKFDYSIISRNYNK